LVHFSLKNDVVTAIFILVELVLKIYSLKQCITLHKNSGGAAANTGGASAP